MYTFKRKDISESKKAKGISKTVVVDELKYEDLKNVLLNRLCMRYEINRIQRKNQKLQN